VHVQGERAVEEIVAAIERAGSRDDLEVLIVGRGGGSVEDLWAFNDEAVARAIHGCPVPVVSAVGHEKDVTVADLVADKRAATPTMAGELVTPRIEEVLERIDRAVEDLVGSMRERIGREKARVEAMLKSHALRRVQSRLEQRAQQLDFTEERLVRTILERIRSEERTLAERTARLEALDPKAVLARGYAMCDDPESGRLVKAADQARRLERMRVTFRDGSVVTRIEEDGSERKER
jgi:exodeoxyribonuclease VII large subunit